MCLSAIMWARIPKIYFVNDYKATSKIGFDDKPILNAILKKPSSIKIKLIQMHDQQSHKLYDEWLHKSDKHMY
jgi:tRNA(Arg) A34 adenosine deaminase TadA